MQKENVSLRRYYSAYNRLTINFQEYVLMLTTWNPQEKYRRRKIPDQKRSWKSLSPRRSPGPAVTQVHLGWTYYKGRKDELDPLITLPGGVALPPSQLRMMQEQSIDNTSLAYQGMSREALREMINGEATRNSISPRCFIIQELLEEKTVWGRGLVSRSVL